MPGPDDEMNEALIAKVSNEIIALHAEFERWLRGEGSDDFSRIESSLADDFTFISPNGDSVARNELLEGLRGTRGHRRIRIRIENPVLHWIGDGAVLATYEEWHEHADYETARRSTVLLEVSEAAPGGLVWRHVHETWMVAPPSRR